jgi:hypothetical protein
MEPRRSGTLPQSLTSRLSRRTALRASGLGLAVGLAATTSRQVSAQDGTATPNALNEDASFLFVQSATSGTFAANPGAGTPSADGTPTPGGGADYLLTLDGHTGNTVYFSDRPERIFGEAPTDRFLTGLGFTPNDPPNAALVTNDADGNEDILVVELLAPAYDAGSGTITYGVNLLSDYEGGLDFVASRRQDEDLAPTFGTASLFIDDCPDISNCYAGLSEVGPLPGGSVGTCWSWSSMECLPCNGESIDSLDQSCDDAYPSQCDGGCGVIWA